MDGALDSCPVLGTLSGVCSVAPLPGCGLLIGGRELVSRGVFRRVPQITATCASADEQKAWMQAERALTPGASAQRVRERKLATTRAGKRRFGMGPRLTGGIGVAIVPRSVVRVKANCDFPLDGPVFEPLTGTHTRR